MFAQIEHAASESFTRAEVIVATLRVDELAIYNFFFVEL